MKKKMYKYFGSTNASAKLPDENKNNEDRAAVSCSPNAYRLGGVGFGFWLTGKLGRALHQCMAFLAGPAGPCMGGAWHRCMCGAWRCTASSMGGVPDGGWVKACVYYLVGKNVCTCYLDLVKLEKTFF